jgi:hypothetical protein
MRGKLMSGPAARIVLLVSVFRNPYSVIRAWLPLVNASAKRLTDFGIRPLAFFLPCLAVSYDGQPMAAPALTGGPGLWLTLAGLALIIAGGAVAFVVARRKTAVAPIPAPIPQPPTTTSQDNPPVSEPTPPQENAQPLPETAVDNDKTEILNDSPTLLAWLIIRDGEQAGGQYRLFTKTMIGRHPVNDIVLVDSAMSAIHASVAWENDQFVLYDLQSTNGVYVKESAEYSWRRVTTAVLHDAMQIKLGRTVFHVMMVTKE